MRRTITPSPCGGFPRALPSPPLALVPLSGPDGRHHVVFRMRALRSPRLSDMQKSWERTAWLRPDAGPSRGHAGHTPLEYFSGSKLSRQEPDTGPSALMTIPKAAGWGNAKRGMFSHFHIKNKSKIAAPGTSLPVTPSSSSSCFQEQRLHSLSAQPHLPSLTTTSGPHPAAPSHTPRTPLGLHPVDTGSAVSAGPPFLNTPSWPAVTPPSVHHRVLPPWRLSGPPSSLGPPQANAHPPTWGGSHFCVGQVHGSDPPGCGSQLLSQTLLWAWPRGLFGRCGSHLLSFDLKGSKLPSIVWVGPHPIL